MVGDATVVAYSATVASTAIADPNGGTTHDCLTHYSLIGWLVTQPWLDIPPLWHRLQLPILMVARPMVSSPTTGESDGW